MNKPIIAIAGMLAVALSASAQDSGAPPAIYKSNADIVAELQAGATSSASAAGAAVRILPGISVRQRSSSVEQFAVMHPYSIEIYRILEGSGELVTGGLLVGPIEVSETDSNIVRSRSGIDGGLARNVSAGDILVLQPGTPHWFRRIDGESIIYMESRVNIATHPVQFQMP